MTRLAGFPMYDFAEVRTATDDLWRAIHHALIDLGLSDIPLKLTRPHDLPGFWSDRSLLLGQTCGYPLMIGLCGAARYVATPRYKTSFSTGPFHKSLIIAHRGSEIKTLADAQGKVCAINMADSNTGMNLLRLEIAKLHPRASFFARVYETLAHRNSILAVARKDADLASIDCVTFALVERLDPALAQDVKIISETEVTPALPFITSGETDDSTLQILREALIRVSTNPLNRPILDQLMIDGIEVLAPNAYERVRDIENQAIALGYPSLI